MLMELVLDRCSIVIVGDWNLAIFRPDWVGKRLFPDEPEFQFGFDVAPGSGAITHYQSTKVWLAASAGRLEFKPLDQGADAFSAVEESARTVLGLLPETPIGACGINLGFDAKAESSVTAVLTLSDGAALQAASAVVSATKIARTIEFGGSRFNFTIEHDAANEVLKIDFNHHNPVRSGQEALKLLRGNMTKSLDVSRRFLDEVYMKKKTGVSS